MPPPPPIGSLKLLLSVNFLLMSRERRGEPQQDSGWVAGGEEGWKTHEYSNQPWIYHQMGFTSRNAGHNPDIYRRICCRRVPDRWPLPAPSSSNPSKIYKIIILIIWKKKWDEETIKIQIETLKTDSYRFTFPFIRAGRLIAVDMQISWCIGEGGGGRRGVGPGLWWLWCALNVFENDWNAFKCLNRI